MSTLSPVLNVTRDEIVKVAKESFVFNTSLSFTRTITQPFPAKASQAELLVPIV